MFSSNINKSLTATVNQINKPYFPKCFLANFPGFGEASLLTGLTEVSAVLLVPIAAFCAVPVPDFHV